jgi:hypothetical protein
MIADSNATESEKTDAEILQDIIKWFAEQGIIVEPVETYHIPIE